MISRFLFKLWGWKVKGHLPDLNKYIILCAPHTATREFPLGTLYYMTQNLRVNVLIKKEFFFFPMGALLRKLGAIPVNRGHNRLIVEVANAFNNSEKMVITITPEGTRQLTTDWKKGFWHIAKRANIPYVPCYIDYAKKEIGLGKPIYPGDDVEKDMYEIKKFYTGIGAKYPERFTTGLEGTLTEDELNNKPLNY